MPNVIQTAETWYRGVPEGIAPADMPATLFPPAAEGSLELPNRGEVVEEGPGSSTVAHVNYGRWVVPCPFCGSACVGSPADPRFFCAGNEGCCNAYVGGAYVNVVYPADPERGYIETILSARVRREHMQWQEPEDVAGLLAENALLEAQGLATPVDPSEVGL